ncbi:MULTISPECIES: ABC transporter substrate-binding protein [Marinobacter]|jgi:putative ABC transport system substrate-binding protein|uniref:ABC transporter permease n=1 Tax=Marinobacter nauticus TaxID=2743 RepID=D9UAK8_MARNT|nr:MULTISPECIES: ABC transporter substrate-binding protein [Marinobacter]MEC7433190.1 ABC transporter substrate-binding protein [Pseudomonadota bacterium]ERS10308.1 ABC transporter substrate-binding protein [Marinobacter sp. EN3]ERS85622.1 ABC transporter substrate-binding protein [Marinobacter sp. C1S70]ERS86681.1 ABC transporter substrate-binding protein [Marinobacter sp. EVN1]KAE8545045.1 ABC transporter, substrate-binding protein [Marinobacter nauticus]|tara:strand:- start:551 stop:1525 length:975 start_codon:yes stop_codon:yes gene_type:complete
MAKKSLRTLIGASLLAAASLVQADDPRVVAITQIVEHPALDAVHEGVKDELAERGYREGENLRLMHESAQGNSAIASQIARKFVGENPDVIVAIATPSAQTVAAAARNVPVVFSAVTDPVAAKLVQSWEAPGANITGVSDMLPIEKHLDMLQRAMPDAKRIGTVYNPGEANAAALIELLEERLQARGLELVKGAATKTSEVLGAARSLVGKADAIYLTTDNTVISAAEAVISVGERAKIPVFAADTATVERGAVAALGFNYYNHGRQTGAMVARVLEGAGTADMPVETMEELDLYVNPEAAERMGVTLPEDLIQEAVKVVKNDK